MWAVVGAGAGPERRDSTLKPDLSPPPSDMADCETSTGVRQGRLTVGTRFIRTAALTAMGLLLAACPGGDGADPTATASPTGTPAPVATSTPSPSLSPEPSPTGSPSPEPSPSPDTATPSPAPSPAPPPGGGGRPAGFAPATELGHAEVTTGAPDTAFGATSAATRGAQSGFGATLGILSPADCPVRADSGESIQACALSFAPGAPDGAGGTGAHFAVVASNQDGTDVSRLYRYDVAIAAFRASREARGVRVEMVQVSPWTHADGLIVVATSGHFEVIAFDSADGPRSAATFPRTSGRDVVLTAQQIMVTSQESGGPRVVAVYDPPSGGALQGTRTEASGHALPEEVALRLYRAWIAGDRATGERYATAAVVRALFDESPARGDAFSLDGRSCPLSNDVYRCGWVAGGASMIWDLAPIEGAVRVFRIASQAG